MKGSLLGPSSGVPDDHSDRLLRLGVWHGAEGDEILLTERELNKLHTAGPTVSSAKY